LKEGEAVATVEATERKEVIVSHASEATQAWELIQRRAKCYIGSTLILEHFRGNISNGVIALEMADILGVNPLLVMQNIYIVNGKAGWAATFMIGRANSSGIFKDPIDWETTGKGDSLSVTAYSVVKATNKKVQVTCDMKMAVAEGWTKNPKYKSMPEQMLKYRSATFLIRLYCPQVMFGMQTSDELSDMTAAQVQSTEFVDLPVVTREAPKMPELAPRTVEPLDPNDPEAEARRQADLALENQDSEP
jgi:hypothetical protein